MVNLSNPASKAVGGASLLVAASCCYQSISALSRGIDGKKTRNPENYLQRQMTAVFGKPSSVIGRAVFGLMESIAWLVPTVAFATIAAASLDPKGQYVPTDLASRLTGIQLSASSQSSQKPETGSTSGVSTYLPSLPTTVDLLFKGFVLKQLGEISTSLQKVFLSNNSLQKEINNFNSGRLSRTASTGSVSGTAGGGSDESDASSLCIVDGSLGQANFDTSWEEDSLHSPSSTPPLDS